MALRLWPPPGLGALSAGGTHGPPRLGAGGRRAAAGRCATLGHGAGETDRNGMATETEPLEPWRIPHEVTLGLPKKLYKIIQR